MLEDCRGAFAAGLGNVGAKLGMGRFLAMQAQGLGDKQSQKHQAYRMHGVGFDLPNHFQHLHHSQGAHIM